MTPAMQPLEAQVFDSTFTSQGLYLIKMAIVGGSCAGKSQLMHRFTDDSYANDHFSTHFLDFKLRNVEIDGTRCKLQIWDVAGSPLASAFCRGAKGIVFA